MKKLVIASLLALIATTPALAKQRHMVSPQAAAAYAYAPGNESPYAVDSYTVVVNGQIAGRDPDPNVRLMLLRDPWNDAS